MVAFQFEGEILYRCCRPIQTGEEFLVWYGEEYARDFDITFDYLWNTKCFDKGMKKIVLVKERISPVYRWYF